MWYKNTGGVYHKADITWVRKGQAICGMDISHPGFFAKDGDFARLTLTKCKKCVTKEAKARGL